MDLANEELYRRLRNDSDFLDKINEFQSGVLDKIKATDKDQYENILLVQKIRFSLIDESDRGCVLLSVSYLEDALGKYVLSYLKGNKTFKKKMLNYNLSNFSSRINFAYSIGLINEKLMNDLNIIRNIRNEFAHSFEPIDFNSEKIDKLVKGLQYKFRDGDEVNNRRQLTTYIFSLLGIILPYQNKSLDIKKPIDIELKFLNVQKIIKKQVEDM